jgi:tRNA A37 threonylcarbamoyladenosine modification protein TsaB
VSSLRVLARGASALRAHVLAVIDAGKGELFGAAYQREGELLRERMEPLRATPEVLAQRIETLGLAGAVLCGAGARAHAPTLCSTLGADALLAPEPYDIPSARFLADEAVLQLAALGPSELATLEPSYLRDSDAKLPERPLRVG